MAREQSQEEVNKVFLQSTQQTPSGRWKHRVRGIRLLRWCSTCPLGGAATPCSQPHRVLPQSDCQSQAWEGREPRKLPGLLHGMLLFFCVHKHRRAKKTCLLTVRLLSDLTLPRARLPQLVIRPLDSRFSRFSSSLTLCLAPHPPISSWSSLPPSSPMPTPMPKSNLLAMFTTFSPVLDSSRCLQLYSPSYLQ